MIRDDVGQAFFYAAKGGKAHVLGNTAGRSLVSAVGGLRAVIHGTSLDYLAESFMAGDPLTGRGFGVLNGVEFDPEGELCDLDSPYSGGNLCSFASGGAVYVRDPHNALTPSKLNGGELGPLPAADWELIRPYLEENARLFGISVARLLTVNGASCTPDRVYRLRGLRSGVH